MTPAELRRLLELAAKAAGIDIEWSHFGAGRYGFHDVTEPSWIEWNPENDDGDSRRLQVALRINVDLTDNTVAAENGIQLFHETLGNDPYAATRLAVLRTAAAIGEAMP